MNKIKFLIIYFFLICNVFAAEIEIILDKQVKEKKLLITHGFKLNTQVLLLMEKFSIPTLEKIDL